MTSQPIRIGLAGAGTVGAGVVDLLARHPQFKVTAIAVRDALKPRDFNTSGIDIITDPLQLGLRDDVDVVVEVMGGANDPALSLIRNALRAGKPVITANKACLATHGNELFGIAHDTGTPLLFEACVGGGMPVVKLFAQGLAANKIQAFSGILNGTCNYILTQMEETEKPFDDVLADAQKLGYAESDPAADIDGHDTAHKAAILTYIVTGTLPKISDIDITGIRNVTLSDIHAARARGERIKLLAEYIHGNVRVAPVSLPVDHMLGRVGGVMNAVWYSADPVGEGMITGRGAGAGPTASAVVADLLDLTRHL